MNVKSPRSCIPFTELHDREVKHPVQTRQCRKLYINESENATHEFLNIFSDRN